jgi:hypothetical protein
MFLAWRADYRERSRLGEETVSTAVAPLLQKAPPLVNPELWTASVQETRDMLVRVVRSGLLTRDQLQSLGDTLKEQSDRARPETAALELVRIWDDMEGRAWPVLVGASYPPLLISAMAIRPLRSKVPPGVEPATWQQAVDAASLLLVGVTGAGRLAPGELKSLSSELSKQAHAATNETARQTLARIWAEAASGSPAAVLPPRPELLDEPASPRASDPNRSG